MSVQMSDVELVSDRSNIVRLKISGRLTVEDYEFFVPQIEQKIQEHGRIRIVFEMIDFRGWSLAALWHDAKFDWKHFRDIDRIAMIGDRLWEHGMALFCRPFTVAEIRYFDNSEAAEMEDWIAAADDDL